MKIDIIGGGPAGLYFAILMKKADPRHIITVYERNRPNDTFGWGVVFSAKTMNKLGEYDVESHRRIVESFVSWDNVVVAVKHTQITVHGNSFTGISRLRILNILQERCTELGIEQRYETNVTDLSQFADADLIVAADGINSEIRTRFREHFDPEISTRPNKYIWYGTHQPFFGLTLTFRENKDGVFAAHSYKFSEDTSTFIIECDAETWRKAGFDRQTDLETRAYLEKVFEPDLGGHPLLSNNSKWLNFLHVRNNHWFYENIVLMGDALHTAHFSIGSGTKLAMEDSIALYEAIMKYPFIAEALPAYQSARKPSVDEYQEAAFTSLVWFENLKQYIDLSPMDFAYRLMMRSGRIGHENLRKRDPEFVAKYEAEIGERY